MYNFLKLFHKEAAAPVAIFETTLEQQLECDKLVLEKSPDVVPDVPLIVQKFVIFFRDHGIFRTTGSLAKVKLLKASIHPTYAIELNETFDIQAIASCFKLWLRELKDGVVPVVYFDDCVKGIHNNDEMKTMVAKLPTANRATLAYICAFLKALASHAEVNLMTANNLAIVFGPCLVRIPASDVQPALVMKQTLKTNDIINQLLDNFECIFGTTAPATSHPSPAAETAGPDAEPAADSLDLNKTPTAVNYRQHARRREFSVDSESSDA
ncbi:Rho GTPase activating protein 24 [Kappamyces sp. JEL0680]|nr:Rho GTPase activating protein 24 [Kappamyces sp. JEL0680]